MNILKILIKFSVNMEIPLPFNKKENTVILKIITLSEITNNEHLHEVPEVPLSH